MSSKESDKDPNGQPYKREIGNREKQQYPGVHVAIFRFVHSHPIDSMTISVSAARIINKGTLMSDSSLWLRAGRGRMMQARWIMGLTSQCSVVCPSPLRLFGCPDLRSMFVLSVAVAIAVKSSEVV